MIIYCLININTGKKYVGKTKKDISVRFNEHIYNAFNLELDFYLYQSMRKHGSDAFSYEILEQCINEEKLDEQEKYWIKTLETYKPNIGYNGTMGGDGGHITPEIRAKISKANKGRVQTLEDRQKKSKAAKGRKHSSETLALLKIVRNERPLPTEETRKKMSEAAKKRWGKQRQQNNI
jgi:group I intron endonuclease